MILSLPKIVNKRLLFVNYNHNWLNKNCLKSSNYRKGVLKKKRLLMQGIDPGLAMSLGLSVGLCNRALILTCNTNEVV